MLNTNCGLAKAPIWQPQLPLALLSFFSPPPLFFVAFHPPPPSVPSNQQNSHFLYTYCTCKCLLFLSYPFCMVSNSHLMLRVNTIQILFCSVCKQRKVIMPFHQTNFQHCLYRCLLFGASAVPIVHPNMF